MQSSSPGVDDLDRMVDHVRAQPDIFQPSGFWQYFDTKNTEQIKRVGLLLQAHHQSKLL